MNAMWTDFPLVFLVGWWVSADEFLIRLTFVLELNAGQQGANPIQNQARKPKQIWKAKRDKEIMPSKPSQAKLCQGKTKAPSDDVVMKNFSETGQSQLGQWERHEEPEARVEKGQRQTVSNEPQVIDSSTPLRKS